MAAVRTKALAQEPPSVLRAGREVLGPLWLPLLALVATRTLLWLAQPFASEDAYITFRYASMFVRGEGLVYNPGERVMGFTSLPWTLWCALGVALRVDLVAWTRVTTLLADAVTLVVGTRILTNTFSSSSGLCFAIFFACWPLFAASAVSGLEPNIVLAALLVTAALLHARSRWAGVALGVFALMRPECLLAAAILGLRARARDRWIAVAIVGVALAAVWLYYGSPIPQSVVAKAAIYGTAGPWAGRHWWEWLLPFRLGRFAITTEGQHLESIAVVFAAALAQGAVLLWRARTSPVTMAAAAGASIWLGYSALGVAYFWWYLVVPLAALALAASVGFPVIVRGRWLPVAALLFVLGSWSLGLPLYVGRAQAEAREFATLAAYLEAQVTPGDEVFLEPIGMVGFRAPVRVTDEVGLVSPEVARRRMGGPGWYFDIVRAHAPRWLVIRPDLLLTGSAFAGAGAPFRSEHERSVLLQSYELVWPEQPTGEHALQVFRRRL